MELKTHSNLLSIPPSRIHTEKSKYLNFMFSDIAEQRDLPSYKHDLAEERYGSVAEWFDSAPDSDPLSQINIKIYAIGSFLSSTTVKPLTGDEFDVDMAGELQLDYRQYPDPRAAVDIFEQRLRKNKRYDEIAERKTRVIRLDYAGDFHLDFMPCFPADLNDRTNTAIKIPHKVTDTLYVYKDSDPLGLNLWFENKSKLSRILDNALSARADNEIVPFPTHQNNKPPLKLALQNLKHARNLYFTNDEEGLKDVSTVILKVLLGKSYNGEQNVYYIMKDAISKIYAAYYYIDNPVIENPINKNEDFAEKWRSDPNRIVFKKFKGFLQFCLSCFQEIETAEDYPSMLAAMKKMFGETEVNKAYDKVGKSVTANSKKGLVGVTASGGLVSSSLASAASKLKGHEFYGTK